MSILLADYLADLERERDELIVVIERIQVALRGHPNETAAAPSGLTVVDGKAKAPRAKGLVRPGSQKPRRGLTPAEIENAKARWLKGDSPTEIAKSVGKASTWCYTAAKGYGWPPRGSGSTSAPPKRGRPPLAKDETKRRCNECGQLTAANKATCSACGEITG